MCHCQNPIALCYKVTRLLEAVCVAILRYRTTCAHVLCAVLNRSTKQSFDLNEV